MSESRSMSQSHYLEPVLSFEKGWRGLVLELFGWYIRRSSFWIFLSAIIGIMLTSVFSLKVDIWSFIRILLCAKIEHMSQEMGITRKLFWVREAADRNILRCSRIVWSKLRNKQDVNPIWKCESTVRKTFKRTDTGVRCNFNVTIVYTISGNGSWQVLGIVVAELCDCFRPMTLRMCSCN